MSTDRGVSLVEVLVALLLLQFALLALVPMFVQAMQFTVGAGEMGQVGVLATRRMEQLRGVPFAALTAGGDLATDVVGFSDLSDPDFTIRWRITDDATPATLKTIEVRVIAARAAIGTTDDLTLVNIAAQEPAP